MGLRFLTQIYCRFFCAYLLRIPAFNTVYLSWTKAKLTVVEIVIDEFDVIQHGNYIIALYISARTFCCFLNTTSTFSILASQTFFDGFDLTIHYLVRFSYVSLS